MEKEKEKLPEKKQVDTPKGILTIIEIKALNIIQTDDQKHDENCFSNASYDFRIGEKYALPSEDTDNIKIKEANTIECPHRKNDKPKIYSCSKDNYVIRIPAFTSIVIASYEKVAMPNFVAGRFDLRIKWALQGLILQVGTQIEPGYNGRLFGLLHNLSNKEICIPFKDRLLTAEFAYTTSPTNPTKTKDSINDIENFLVKYHAISGTLEYFLKEMNAARIKMDKGYERMLEGNRFRMTILLGIASVFFSVFLSIGVTAIISKNGLTKEDYPFQKVYEMENDNKTLREEIKTMNESVVYLKSRFDSINNLQHEKKLKK